VRAASFKVSGELLRQALHMPETAEFVQASVGEFGHVDFVVTDPSLPEATVPHRTEPMVTRLEGDETRWDWGLPGADGCCPHTVTTWVAPGPGDGDGYVKCQDCGQGLGDDDVAPLELESADASPSP